MKLKRLPLALILASLTLNVQSDEREKPKQELDDVVLASSYRAAFYEAAPRRIAESMRKGIGRECESRNRRTPEKEEVDTAWLCDSSKKRFFREVNIMGTKTLSGFICNEQGIGEIKYLIDAIAESDDLSCVRAIYQDDSKTYLVWYALH